MAINILIWDFEESPPEFDGVIILWRSVTSKKSKKLVSIPFLVESNDEYCKRQYLSWINDLGQTMTLKSQVRKDLAIRRGLSYWWMTPLAQKSNFSKSPQITEAIRLIAFDDWAKAQEIETLEFGSSNRNLKTVLQSWCEIRKVRFITPKSPKEVHFSILHTPSLRKSLSIIRSSVFISKHIINTRKLRKVGLKNWKESKAKITFVSYLFNLEKEDMNEAHFRSPFWGHLPDELNKLGEKTNWIHIYVSDSKLPRAVDASALIKRFNLNNSGQVHTTLDSFTSFQVVLTTFRDMVKIRRVMNRLPNYLSKVQCGELNLWPLFEFEWGESVNGPELIQHILNLNQFESAFGNLDKQVKGVYLYEQQPWEMALITAWKLSGHEELIAAQHSTMLYWDLRYFHDLRSYESKDNLSLPLPDIFAMNGNLSSKICREWNYPEAKIREVEALRFLYLNSSPELAQSLSDRQSPLRLLVLLDYLKKNTDSQLRVLKEALLNLPIQVEITVKSHPACPVSSEFHDFVRFISNKPVSQLIRESDVAFVGATTSAALDAYCFGLPVITLGDSTALNLSPLRGFYDSVIVYSPTELVHEITKLRNRIEVNAKLGDIFTLDSELFRWKNLLLSPREKLNIDTIPKN